MLKLGEVIRQSKIGLSGYAKLLGITDATLHDKLAEKDEFSYGEYRKLQSLFPKYNIDYLLRAYSTTPAK